MTEARRESRGRRLSRLYAAYAAASGFGPDGVDFVDEAAFQREAAAIFPRVPLPDALPEEGSAR